MGANKSPIASVAAMLGLQFTGREWDWDIEFADPLRVEEFVAAYSSNDLSQDEKYVLMSLILTSAEEALEKEICSAFCIDSIRAILRRDAAFFPELLDNWRMRDDYLIVKYISDL